MIEAAGARWQAADLASRGAATGPAPGGPG
jgi:hypothetical protein